MYLAGYAIEILLKANMLEKYYEVVQRQQAPSGELDRQRWHLFRRSHDLHEMLDHLQEREAAILGRPDGRRLLIDLRTICGTWTIYARYSTASSTIAEARKMVERVRRLKELLK